MDEFNSIVMDLHNINVQLDDEDLAIILLYSLSASFKHFCETFFHGMDELVLEDVKSDLPQ